jgi:hypothetical protein
MEIETNNEFKSTSETVSSNCSNCSNEITFGDIFCTQCGFPENGSEEEKSLFLNKKGQAGIDLQQLKKKVKSAKNTLIAISVMSVIGGIVFGIKAESYLVLGIMLVVAGIFFGLSVYCKKKPLPALLTGTLLYLTLLILDAFADPTTIYQGIIVKAIILVFLFKGISSANEAKNLMKRYANEF